MTTMMLKIEEFVRRNGMSEDVKREMLEILNESLLEISRGIMNEKRINERKEINEELKDIMNNKKEETKKRFKSKKAEEYAEENGLSLEDFNLNEISKKDVETKVREITKNKKDKVMTTIVKTTEQKSIERKREKVICSGINKKGEACKSVGTIQPDGAKKKYCIRHAEDFKSFECDSDSSDEEPEECIPCETNNTQIKNSKENSDDELVEEEYN